MCFDSRSNLRYTGSSWEHDTRDLRFDPPDTYYTTTGNIDDCVQPTTGLNIPIPMPVPLQEHLQNASGPICLTYG